MIKVSIIIPVYNNGKYLRTCLDSLVNQTLKDIEIIAVDDNSSDNSLLILMEYAKKYPNIKVYHNRKNLGQGATRNKGLEYAKGEYIGFVDSDDYVRYNMYEDMYKAAINNNAPLVTTMLLYVTEDLDLKNDVVCKSDPIVYDPTIDINKEQVVSDSPSACNKLFKRELIGHYRFLENTFFEDVAFSYYMLMKSDKIVILPYFNYFYRINNYDSLSFKTYKKTDKIYDIFKVLERLEEDVKSINKYNIFKDEIRFLKLAYSITQLFDINKWDVTKEEKEEALRKMSETIYNKYGMLRKREISLLCSKLGNETVVLYLQFLAAKGKIKMIKNNKKTTNRLTIK